jgi:hypothetical protein
MGAADVGLVETGVGGAVAIGNAGMRPAVAMATAGTGAGAVIGMAGGGAAAVIGTAFGAPVAFVVGSGIMSKRQEEIKSTPGTALDLVAPRSTPWHTASSVSSSGKTDAPAAQTLEPREDMVPWAEASIWDMSSRKVSAAVSSRELNGTGGNCSTT